MAADLAIGTLTLLGAVLLGARIYRALLARWGDDEFEYYDLPPARSHVVLVRDEDGAA